MEGDPRFTGLKTLTTTALANQGLLVLHPSPPAARRTLVVLGVARSGTSLVAGALHHLGVFMGEKAPAPVYEDMPLGAAVEAGDLGAARDLLRRYDQAHDLWGWKRPGALHHLQAVHGLLRNPRYVVIFRDVFAIANRNRISMGAGVVENMLRSVEEYRKLLDFLQHESPPALLVSYDKALRHKEAFVDTLCEFAGLDADAAARRGAVEFITPSPEAYLRSTRAGRVVGHLDVVQPDRVLGWAARQPDPGTAPLQVSLSVNGHPVAAGTADRPRPDLVTHGVHPTGFAGFELALPAGGTLRPGDRVQVHAGSDGEELNGSPWIYEA